MVILEMNNATKDKIAWSFLTQIFNRAQKILKIKNDQTVSLAFVSPQKIKKLNFIYRGKNKATDVLSFIISEKNMLGEIIVCPKIARKQADFFKHSLKKELSKLFIHGYLHLLGFDHETISEAEQMEKIEKKILE